MMYKASIAAAMLASAAQAITIYSKDSCGSDPNDGELLSLNFDVDARIEIVDGQKVSSCNFVNVGLPDWPQTEGQYKAFIDQSTLPADCTAVFFNGAPDDDQINTGACWQFYRRVPDDQKCASINIPPTFGVSLCCSPEACAVQTGDFPTQPPSKRSLPMSPAPKAIRDVTGIKRAAPLQQKRAECAWESEGKTALKTYGQQVKVTGDLNCQNTETCTDGITFGVESSVSNTFGTETSVSADFFKVMSASVSFSYEHTDTETKSTEITYTGGLPPNSKGYLSFQPRLECSPKGKFTGDCDGGIPTDIDGDVCWPVFLPATGVADGVTTFVQTN